MESLSRLRIGYVPQSPDFSRPGDRRRFCHYAALRGIKVEVPENPGDFDLIVLSQSADLTAWTSFPRGRTKLVFDFVDSYLSEKSWSLRSTLRGLGKFIVRQNSKLRWNYRRLLMEMCARADAVVCSTLEQKQQISDFCRNTHCVLDFHSAELNRRKTDYSCGRVFNIVWEGLGQNASTLGELREALLQVQTETPIALHIVTDLHAPYALGNYLCAPTKPLVMRRLAGLKSVYLYEWNPQMLSSIITSCDLAIIPIPMDSPFHVGKPENKLLLLWKMAMPVVTSGTPAYAHAMATAGLNLTCDCQAEWVSVLRNLIRSEDRRSEAGRLGFLAVQEQYSESKLVQQWDAVLSSVMQSGSVVTGAIPTCS